MAVKIRLRRVGRKKSPLYRIVVAEIIGQYAPRLSADALKIDSARANHWLEHGAQPSDTVRSLLRRAGILKQRHEARLARKLQSKAVPVAE